jgi:hypothetical protein
LAEPVLQRGDLPAHGPVSQAKLLSRLGIATCPRCDFEHTQSVQRYVWTHRNRE